MTMVDNYLKAPFSAPLAPIGNGLDDITIEVYNAVGTDVKNGAIYALSFFVDATDTANPIVRGEIKAAVVTIATASTIICVVEDSQALTVAGDYGIPAASYGRVRIAGATYALVDGTPADVAVGDKLEVLNTATSFIQAASASSGASGAILGNCAAIALEARATNSAGLQKIYLLGKQVVIAAT